MQHVNKYQHPLKALQKGFQAQKYSFHFEIVCVVVLFLKTPRAPGGHISADRSPTQG